MNKNGIVAILVTIILAVAVAFVAMDWNGIFGSGTSWAKGYGADIEIKDPSLAVVNVNGTYLIQQVGVTNYTYNSTHFTINLPGNWNGRSSSYLYELTNTLSTSVVLHLDSNFTNGAVFTYLIMKNGAAYYAGIPHNATFWVYSHNNLTGKNTTNIVVVHNIKFDGEFVPNATDLPANSTLLSYGGLGDGLPASNTTAFSVPSGYYAYIGIGDKLWGQDHPQVLSTDILLNVNANSTQQPVQSGTLSIL